MIDEYWVSEEATSSVPWGFKITDLKKIKLNYLTQTNKYFTMTFIFFKKVRGPGILQGAVY